MTRQRKTTSRYQPTSHPDIEQDKRSGIFYFRGRIDGKLIDRSLRTSSFTLAKERAKLVTAKALGIEPKSMRIARRSMREVFDRLLMVQSAQAPKTYTMAKTQVKHLRWFEQSKYQYLDEFAKDPDVAWAAYVKAQKILTPGRKLSHDRRHLVMALKGAQAAGWTKKNFTKRHFTLLEATKHIGRAIPDDELRRILSALKQYEKTYIQVMLALYTGMRKSEILCLRVDQVDLSRAVICLDPDMIKTRRPRKLDIPIPPDVFGFVATRVRQAIENGGAFLFPKWEGSKSKHQINWNEPQGDNRYWWNRVREETGITARFHDLRHTVISNLIKQGMPINSICQIVGATEETVSRIYAHVMGDTQAQFKNAFTGKYLQ